MYKFWSSCLQNFHGERNWFVKCIFQSRLTFRPKPTGLNALASVFCNLILTSRVSLIFFTLVCSCRFSEESEFLVILNVLSVTMAFWLSFFFAFCSNFWFRNFNSSKYRRKERIIFINLWHWIGLQISIFWFRSCVRTCSIKTIAILHIPA